MPDQADPRRATPRPWLCTDVPPLKLREPDAASWHPKVHIDMEAPETQALSSQFADLLWAQEWALSVTDPSWSTESCVRPH